MLPLAGNGHPRPLLRGWLHTVVLVLGEAVLVGELWREELLTEKAAAFARWTLVGYYGTRASITACSCPSLTWSHRRLAEACTLHDARWVITEHHDPACDTVCLEIVEYLAHSGGKFRLRLLLQLPAS